MDKFKIHLILLVGGEKENEKTEVVFWQKDKLKEFALHSELKIGKNDRKNYAQILADAFFEMLGQSAVDALAAKVGTRDFADLNPKGRKHMLFVIRLNPEEWKNLDFNSEIKPNLIESEKFIIWTLGESVRSKGGVVFSPSRSGGGIRWHGFNRTNPRSKDDTPFSEMRDVRKALAVFGKN